MASPKKSKDKVAFLTQAEIHNSNRTASLSLGNAQRKSWMSGSQTPVAVKINPFQIPGPRIKKPKPPQKPCPPEGQKVHEAETNITASVSSPINVKPKASESSDLDLHSQEAQSGDDSLARPSQPDLIEDQTQITENSQRASEERLERTQDLTSSVESRLNDARQNSKTAGSEAMIQKLASPEVIDLNLVDDSDDETTQLPLSERTTEDSYSTAAADGVPPPQSAPPTVSAAPPEVGRRPSNLLIPPIRRQSLDLGGTPLSGSSEPQSVFDYSVAPTPPAITSPITELSPSSWSTSLKRGHDAQRDLNLSSKRHQPNGSMHREIVFWDNVKSAVHESKAGNSSNIRQIMKQCGSVVKQKMWARAQNSRRGSIEQPRLQLLHKACLLHDCSFLMIHQLFCHSSMASINPIMSRLSPPDRKALSILNNFLASNSELDQEMVIWFSEFPGPSPAIRSQASDSFDLEWYRASLLIVHSIASHWTGTAGLRAECMVRRYPPTINEMCARMNVYSRTLQEVIFTAVLRNLVPADDPRFKQHEEVFKRDLQMVWNLGGYDVNNRMTCEEEHARIAMSSLPSAESMPTLRPNDTFVANGQSSRQAVVNGIHSQQLYRHGTSQGAQPAIQYDPQAMWPNAIPGTMNTFQPPLERRLSTQLHPPTLPTNDNVPNRGPGDLQRHQSMPNALEAASTMSRNFIANPLQHRNSMDPAFTVAQADDPTSRIHATHPVLRQQIQVPLSSQSRPFSDQTSPTAIVNNFGTQNILPSNVPLVQDRNPSSHHRRPSEQQLHHANLSLDLRASARTLQRNPVNLLYLHRSGLGPLPNGKTPTASFKVDTGTHERCFQYVKHIYKPVDALSSANPQYQQEIVLAQKDIDLRAREVQVERVMTTLLYPGTLTFRVRCLKVPPRKSIRADEHWVLAEQHWPISIALLFNDRPLNLQRKSAHAKDLPVDITGMVRLGTNTLSVATFSMPKQSSDQYLVGIEVIETVTYTQIKNYIQPLPLEAAKRRITSKMGNEDPDIEVLDPSITVDLTDPFTSVIFTTPARGVSCSHDQCFDLDTFLSTRMGSGGSKNGPCAPEEFRCPICKGDARPSKIIVDDFLRLVRARLEDLDRLDVKAIKIDIDGDWVIKEEAPSAEDSAADGDDRNGLASPTNGMTPRASISGQAAGSSSAFNAIEVIDLD